MPIQINKTAILIKLMNGASAVNRKSDEFLTGTNGPDNVLTAMPKPSLLNMKLRDIAAVQSSSAVITATTGKGEQGSESWRRWGIGRI